MVRAAARLSDSVRPLASERMRARVLQQGGGGGAQGLLSGLHARCNQWLPGMSGAHLSSCCGVAKSQELLSCLKWRYDCRGTAGAYDLSEKELREARRVLPAAALSAL